VRSYEQAVRKHLEPMLGPRRLHEVHRRDVQRLVDQLRADGLKPSTVHNKLDPLRVMFRRAVEDDTLTVWIQRTGSGFPPCEGSGSASRHRQARRR
jgi:site-specific recombinase XerD